MAFEVNDTHLQFIEDMYTTRTKLLKTSSKKSGRVSVREKTCP